MAFIGNTYTTQGFIPAIDYFNGNGSTTAFTLSRPVASVAQVQAVIENVPQNPGSAYTVSGNTITFTSAPPSGTSNIYVYYTSPITQVIAPGQGTVTTTSLGNITNIASGNSSLTLQTGTTPTTAMTIDTSQNVGIGTASPTARLTVSTNTNNEGEIRISDNATYYAGLRRVNATDEFRIGSYGASQNITFYTVSSERMRIDSSGNLLVGTTTTSGIQTATAGGAVFNKESSGVSLWVTRGNGGGSTMNVGRTSGAGTGTYIEWFYNNTNTGTVTTSGTTTAYNTSSDYRLKHDIQPMTGALAKVAALKPVTYKWNADDSAGEGFIAHELAEVVPQCVTGEKDAVNADGNPIYQGIDTSFLVATLTAAIQEQQSIITQLTERISALEGK